MKNISDDLSSFCLQVLDLEDLEKAESFIDENRRRYDDTSAFHLVNASVRLRQSKIEEAITSARRATAISPSSFDCSFFLARVLIGHSNNYEEACKECERSLSLYNSEDFDPDESLGLINIEFLCSPETTAEARIAFYQEQLRSFLVSAKNKLKKIVRPYLESLTLVEMRNLLEIDVEKLKGYNSDAFLLEALQYAEANHSWKYWACPCCDQKFGDRASHLRHASQHYMSNLTQERKSLFPEGVDQDWADRVANGNWDPIDADAAVKMHEEMPECDEWPISDNEERINLLKRISALFRLLLKYNYLAKYNFEALFSYMIKFKAPPSTTKRLKSRMKKEPTVYLRILDSSALNKVLCYLQNLSDSCDLGMQSKKDCFFDIEVSDVSDSELAKRILFVRKSSKLILCPWGFSFSSTDDVFMRCMPDVEGFISWLYEGPSVDESFLAMAELKKSRAAQSGKIIHMLQKKYGDMVNQCDEKGASVRYLRNLLQIVGLCCDESAKRENEFQSYEAILRKKKEEIEKELALRKEKRATGLGPTVLVNVISHVLEKAREQESGNDLQDACIQDVFSYVRSSTVIKLSRLDTSMFKILFETQQLELMLGTASSLDYLKVFLPLVKSFLQKFIKEEAVKFAETKSEAASEALIRDLELGAKKSKDTGAGHLTQTQDMAGQK